MPALMIALGIVPVFFSLVIAHVKIVMCLYVIMIIQMCGLLDGHMIHGGE